MNEPVPVERDERPARTVETADHPISLFHDEEDRGFRTRWDAIQTGFVDQPRAAVEQANALVGEMVKRLTDTFGSERSKLEMGPLAQALQELAAALGPLPLVGVWVFVFVGV